VAARAEVGLPMVMWLMAIIVAELALNRYSN